MGRMVAKILPQAALFLVYLTTAHFGLKLDSFHGFASVVWPPTGIALAALLLGGLELWPAVFAAAVVANLVAGAPLPAAVGVGLGNLGEAVFAALALQRFDFHPRLDRIRDVLFLLLIGSVLSTLVSATVGTASLMLFGNVKSEIGTFFTAWWVGNALSDLLVAPFLLVWGAQKLERVPPAKALEMAGVALATLTLGLFLFCYRGSLLFSLIENRSFLFLAFPPVIWAALRFGQRGNVSVVASIAAMAVWGTASGRGPFVGGGLRENLLSLLLFVLTFALSGFFLAAAIEEVDARTETRRILEKERAAREAAERAGRQKDEFLAMLSHELRTPLTVILLWTRMLRKGKVPRDKMEEAIATIERNAETQSQLVSDLLDVSRIISGKFTLECKSLDINGLTAEVIDELRPIFDQKELRVEASFAGGKPFVFGDSTRLKQVVRNILGNAIKFSPAGGVIEIATRIDEGWFALEILDEGPGIPVDFLPKIFDRFSQADGSSTRGQGGLGLGLSIVREIVSRHGGSVEAANAGERKGALFRVNFPCVESAGSTPEAEPASQIIPWRQGGKRQRILVVDDSKDTREVISAGMLAMGLEVKDAGSAAAAMDLLQSFQPDILVCDIAMPEEDGYSLIRRVRTLGSAQGGAVPAVALTACAGAEDRRRALEAGFNEHLAKPIDWDSLSATIQQLT
jgi:signal transduction histidine kinase